MESGDLCGHLEGAPGSQLAHRAHTQARAGEVPCCRSPVLPFSAAKPETALMRLPREALLSGEDSRTEI